MTDDNKRPQQQGDRDTDGRLMPGHSVGVTTRFKPGESGNPGGTAVGGQKPGRWILVHGDMTTDELQRVLDDPRASMSAKACAHLWLDTADPDPNVRRNAWRVLIERAEGKACQPLEVVSPQDPKTGPAKMDLDLLTVEELRQLEKIHAAHDERLAHQQAEADATKPNEQ
ncbi:MAG: hypothetical protein GC164_14405 [Phycisphaera sp.]|nr:hypothetical protein [Phycisphaera sp.]